MNRTTPTSRARLFFAALLSAIFSLAWIAPPQALGQLPGRQVVAITSPASGSAVEGTIPVRASVSPAGALVVAVQFRLDGADLGAEDTTAPYSVPWDTTITSNGSHTLTAVARDALGLEFISDPVTVTVSNDTAAPTVTITSPASGSTVSGAITVSATASDDRGVVGVQFKLDGADLGAEDATAPYSISWDTATASDGSHTLTAVARDGAGNRAVSEPVTVTVSNAPPPPPPPPPPGPVTRFEETDPSIAYSGAWEQGNTARAWSTGTAAVSRTAGDQATFTFTGTAVSWIGFRGPQAGIARVFLDGVFAAEVDMYSATEEVQAVVFSATELAETSHTLTIEVTGLMNPASSMPIVVVDAFDVASSSPPPPPPERVTRFEETDPSIAYSGAWEQGNTARAWSTGTAAVSRTAGDQATFTFTGTAVSWIGFRGPQAGIARVFLDGVFAAEIDMYSATEEVQAVVFTATGLAETGHALMIEVTGLMNPASSMPIVVVDAFEVRN